MAEIQHSNIPDEFLHEVKHAEQAATNTFLRAKGDGTTEFVFLSIDSFPTPTLLRDDTNLTNSFDVTLQLNKQYIIMLSKTTDGTTDYINDMFDLRGMSTLPTGTGKLTSIGGKCVWQNGKLTADAGWFIFRMVEVN